MKRSINVAEVYELPAPVSGSARHLLLVFQPQQLDISRSNFPERWLSLTGLQAYRRKKCDAFSGKSGTKNDFCIYDPVFASGIIKTECYLATVCVRLAWSLSFHNKHTHDLARLSVVSGKICHVTASHLTSFGLGRPFRLFPELVD